MELTLTNDQITHSKQSYTPATNTGQSSMKLQLDNAKNFINKLRNEDMNSVTRGEAACKLAAMLLGEANRIQSKEEKILGNNIYINQQKFYKTFTHNLL